MDMCQIAGWLFKLFFPGSQKVYLTVDRTNWEFGKQPVNVLMLGIAYEGMSIPLLWRLLPKKGSSNTKERIDLLKRFIDQFGKDYIEGLLCDRELCQALKIEAPRYCSKKDRMDDQVKAIAIDSTGLKR